MTLLALMAGIGVQFNAGDHNERTRGGDPVPKGWYIAQIVNSEIKPTKTPGGARLNIQFKILQGDFINRVAFGGYNVQNSNPVAVNIAMEELAELSKAVGVPVWNDTEQLHGIPFNLKLKIKHDEGYEPSNEPDAYKHINDSAGIVYATKADVVKSAPVGAGFGSQQPQQGFGANAQQPTGQPGWAQPQQPQQQVQQPVQQFQQQQPQQQVQQPTQQQPQQGNVNFQQAATQQPWGQQGAQPQQQVQQPQQTAQQPVQEQPVQQQPVQQQPQQQAVQQQEQPVQQQQQQPAWANQQVQPGTEQPQQQTQQAQQVQEQPDAIQETAQTQTPPWKVEQ